MKNFKKVISAVIAMSLAASSLVAVNASKFTDVADTANCAEAVEVLSAMGIVSGYEDGTFKPEGEITRAEAATMIVGALNMTDDAKAAAGSSKFADVNEKANWATGYVNVGVAQGFINGMDDTTFAPQENVTYAQMCVMLTKITGYGEYAENYGGYPTGYTTMAASSGINKGVAVATEAKLTRGQVAQMLYNALKTPMLGVVEYSLAGNTYAELNGGQKANGEFKTLLSDKFDGYVVTAEVAATSKGDPALENGEAKLNITKADWWDGAEVKANAPVNGVVVLAEVGGIENYLYQSGTGIILIDDNDDNHLIYFAASSKVESKELAAADYLSNADGGKSIADGKITFDKKDYKLDSTTVDVYVNGVLKVTNPTEAQIAQILGGAQGNVTLVKSGDSATGYNKILVSYYDVAKVTSVTYSNGKTTIQVSPVYGLNTISSIVIDDESVEDGDVLLTVEDADGNALELANIKKGDIIAYAAEAQSGSSLKNPSFIDLLVTNEKTTGKVSARDDEEKVYSIDGTDYQISKTTWDSSLMEIGNSYELTLDPFGRIFSVEIATSSEKYAIAEKYDDDYGLQIILPGGTSKYYELASSCTITGAANIDDILYNGSNKKNPTERVIKYTLKNSTSEITSIKVVGVAETAMTYKARTEKLGSYSITDATDIIDASDYVEKGLNYGKATDYSSFAMNSFSDDVEYQAAAFKATGSTVANFVVVTKLGYEISADSRFAVVRKKAVQAETEDGDECYKMNVLYNGEETELAFNYNPSLAVGDAFFFTLDGEGLVKADYKVFTKSQFDKKSATAPFATLATVAAGKYEASDWDFTLKNSANKDIQLVYGVVTDVKSNLIEFARVSGNVINLNNEIAADDMSGYTTFGIDSDCVAYRYGLSDIASAAKQYEAIYAISADGVVASTLDAYETDTNSDIFNLTNSDGEGYSHLTYALAMVVDGDVVAVYSINQ